MRIKPEARTCLHCKKKFIPDYRNCHHQQFCTKPACRRASKRHSQARWLAKNPGFFRGHEHVIRVQVWRQDKGRGRGRLIFKLVMELLVFRRKGRRDTVKVVKRDGNGHVLQDICMLKNIITTRVILRLVMALQDVIALLGGKTYALVKRAGKVQRGRKKCRKSRTVRRAFRRRSRSFITRR